MFNVAKQRVVTRKILILSSIRKLKAIKKTLNTIYTRSAMLDWQNNTEKPQR